MRRFVLSLFIISLALPLFFEVPAYAAKVRVRKVGAPRAVGVAYSRAKLSRPTNSVILTFLNLGQMKSITYTLSYVANGIPHGAVGTLVVSGQTPDSRDLYFGTCSHGVCTPHYNLKNVALLVQTTTRDEGVHAKRYRIKW
jgi:hypothetical protein